MQRKKPKKDHLIPVSVWRIYPYPDVTPPETFLVVLKGEEDRFVPISIGFPEGQYLVMAMQDMSFPRPLTHNLIKNLLEKVNGEVHQLVVHTLKDETFHAYLLIQTQEEVFYLDCRPSDGMILATLMNLPIYMSPEVMEEAGRELSGMLNMADLSQELAAEAEAAENELTSDAAMIEVEVREQVEESNVVEEVQTEEIGSVLLGPVDRDLSELELLKAHLDRLAAEEAYEEAARIRDQIIQMEDESAS
jgi:bifunctional DNase/RNase